ncbi:hypothetical protein J6590_054314 [Homalodisca vitripennis]|nr:hypothetical protein J6590_054314 [Homalodisca vitripennis]
MPCHRHLGTVDGLHVSGVLPQRQPSLRKPQPHGLTARNPSIDLRPDVKQAVTKHVLCSVAGNKSYQHASPPPSGGSPPDRILAACRSQELSCSASLDPRQAVSLHQSASPCLNKTVQHERGPRKPKLNKEGMGGHQHGHGGEQSATSPLKLPHPPLFPPPALKSPEPPHPMFLPHQPPPPGLLQILMSAEKCQECLPTQEPLAESSLQS